MSMSMVYGLSHNHLNLRLCLNNSLLSDFRSIKFFKYNFVDYFWQSWSKFKATNFGYLN